MKTNIYTIALMVGISVQLVSCGGGEKKEEAPKTDTTAKAEELKEPEYQYTYKVEEVDLSPRWAVVQGDSTDLAGYGAFMGKYMPSVGKGLDPKKMAQEGPFSIAYNFSKEKKFYAVVGFYVTDSTMKVKTPRKLEKMAGGKALKVVYLGDYEKIEPAYMDIEQYMKEKGLKNAYEDRRALEQYMNDPGMEKDTAKWQTDIYVPVVPVP